MDMSFIHFLFVSEPAVLLLMNGLMLNINGPLYGGLMEYFLKVRSASSLYWNAV